MLLLLLIVLFIFIYYKIIVSKLTVGPVVCILSVARGKHYMSLIDNGE